MVTVTVAVTEKVKFSTETSKTYTSPSNFGYPYIIPTEATASIENAGGDVLSQPVHVAQWGEELWP